MTTNTAADTTDSRGILGAAIAVTAWGTGSVIIKAIDLDGLVVAVYRFASYALVLWIGVTALAWRRQEPRSASLMSVRVLRHSIGGGLALGLDVALFFSAIKLTTVVNATLIGAMQPVLVSVVAARFFGERIHRQNILWAGAALTGVCVVVLGSGGDANADRLGDLFAIGALISWSAYFVYSKRSKEHLTSTEFTFGTAVWSMIVNLPLAVAFGQDLSWPDWGSWFALGAVLVVAGFLGHSLMNWSLVRIPLWLGSMFTLLIPVTSSVLAWLFLDESLTAVQMLATVVVIVSLGAIVKRQAAPQNR